MITISEYPKKAGIYKLTCIINDKIYIGKSVNIRQRLFGHKVQKKVRCYFDNAIIKYGWDSFIVDILEIFENFDKEKDNDSLLLRESHYISLYDATNTDKGYNICKFSTDRTGLKRSPHSIETKLKMKLAKTGKIVSDETREKLRQINLGKRHSEETKEKIRQSRIGKKLSTEGKEKLKQFRLGKTHTEESLNKMKLAKLGKIRTPHSEETKEKIRQGNLGKKMLEESKNKMRLAKLGKKKIYVVDELES
jgi:group I intron endonuclease